MSIQQYKQTVCRRARLVAVLSLSYLALAVPPASAQKVGTTSMQFLKVMPTARATAMGSAYAALGEGSEAIFWNPARIVSSSRYDLSLDRIEWFMDVTHHAVSYAMRMGNAGALGIHLYATQVGDIQETRVDQLGFVSQGGTQVYNPGLTGATFSPTSWVVGVSYARSMTDRFSAGVTAKYAREDLYLAKAGVVLFDFGIAYDTDFRSLHLGASVSNFGPPVEFVNDSYPAPMMFRIGVAADLVGTNPLSPVRSSVNRLSATYELQQPNDYDQQWATGLEYAFVERFFLRGGYRFNTDLGSLSFGAGIRQPVGAVALSIDYAYGDMGALFQSVHRFTLRMAFE